MENLQYQDSKFKTLDDNEKKINLGKLKQLETIVELLNTMRESLTRELVVNGCESEEDILQGLKTSTEKRFEEIKSPLPPSPEEDE